MFRSRRARVALLSLAVIAGFLALLLFLQALLSPKYMEEFPEGAMVGEYYDSMKCHDVIFVGDCEIYESYSPLVLYREFGVSAYLRGSPQQLIWQSYELMRETLRYERPRAFVFNIQALQYNTPQKEEYNRMTLDGMRLSPEKLRAISASMTEGESFPSYLFPLLRYHERITQVEREDITYLTHREKVTFEGYLPKTGVDPYTTPQYAPPLPDYSFGEKALTYLDKMVSLCREEGIALIFVKAPSVAVPWYPEWEEQVEEYAAREGIPYYNFLEAVDEIGLDFSLDTYDRGQHLNLSGAQKLSRYFGAILKNTLTLPDRREDSAVAEYYSRLGEETDLVR